MIENERGRREGGGRREREEGERRRREKKNRMYFQTEKRQNGGGEKGQRVGPGNPPCQHPRLGEAQPPKLADLASTSLWSRTCPLTHMTAGIPSSLDSCQQEIPRTKLSTGRLLKLLFI